MESNISLNLYPDRAAVRDDQPSELDLAVDINTGATRASARTELNLHVCLVIDRSGSMSDRSGSMEGTKLDTAKQSCIDIAKRLKATDMMTVVCFDDSAEVIVNPTTPRDQIASKILAVKTGGQTNLSLGWYLGLLELQSFERENLLRRMILLSDGQANSGETRKLVLGREAARARDAGISTSTIGIGDDFQEELLNVLAAESGGRFWYIQDSEISTIIREEFEGNLRVLFDQPRLELRLPSGIQVARNFSDLKLINRRYRLPPIKSEHSFQFAFRLEADPAEAQGGQFQIGATLFSGDAPVAEQDVSIKLLPYEKTVAIPIDPLPSSIVQSYMMARTEEQVRSALESRDFDMMKKMIVSEVGGMRRAIDALESDTSDGRDRSASSRKHGGMLHDLAIHETLSVVTDLCQHLEVNYNKSEAREIDNIVKRLEKFLMMSSHRKSSDHDVHESEKLMLIDHVRAASEIARNALRSNPRDRTLTEIVEAFDECLARLT